MPREVEFQFTLDAHATRRSVAWLAKQGATKIRGPQNFRVVYFDTGNLDLRHAGISLKVCKSADQFVQTIEVSRGRASGPPDRQGWECTVKRFKPDLSEARGPVLKPLRAMTRKLKPLFEVNTRRETFLQSTKRARFEIVADKSSVTAPKGSARFCELAIEPAEGNRRALFNYIRALSAALLLRLSSQSASARGYALLGPFAKLQKAFEVTLSHDMTAEDAFRTIARGCLSHIAAHEDSTIAGDHEALHQMRVGFRRLTACLSAFSEMIAGQEVKRLKREFKWLMGHLGAARDVDVFIDESFERRSTTQKAFLVVEKRVRKIQHANHQKVARVLSSPRYRRLLIGTLVWIEDGAWRRKRGKLTSRSRTLSVGEHAIQELGRRHRKFSRKLPNLKQLQQAELHRWRIRAKKLRYAVEFFGSAFGGNKAKKRCRDLLSALKAFQDGLGALNDISVHEKMMTDLALSGRKFMAAERSEAFAAGVVFEAEESRRETLLDAANKAAQEIASIQPFWD